MADEATGTDTGTDGTTSTQDSGTNTQTAVDGATTFKFQDVPDNVKLFNEFVPDEYRNKEWVTNIAKSANPRLEIFKQIENKDQMLGKQSALTPPGENATKEQIDQYYKAIGIPEDIKPYEYSGLTLDGADKPLAEALNANRPEAFMNDIKTAARELGVTPKQFKALAEAYDKAYITHSKAALEANSKAMADLDADYNQRVQALFGDKTQQVITNGRKLIESCVHSSLLPALGRMDNETLAVVASFAHGFSQKYIREDSPIRSGNTAPVSQQSLIEQRNAIMAHPEYGNPRDIGYKDRLEKVAAIRRQLAEKS